jgi:hypothetical protein
MSPPRPTGSASEWVGHNIEANAILYYTVNLGLSLADVLNDTTVTSRWSKYAANIKSATNAHLWDPSANLYRDNDTVPLTKLHPQDGNAWAVVSNLTLSQAQSANISTCARQPLGQIWCAGSRGGRDCLTVHLRIRTPGALPSRAASARSAAHEADVGRLHA